MSPSFLTYRYVQSMKTQWAISWDYGIFRPPFTNSSNTHVQPSSGARFWFLVGPFLYFHTSCARTAKALARLCGCAGSPEPSLVAYVISTIISWAGSNQGLCCLPFCVHLLKVLLYGSIITAIFRVSECLLYCVWKQQCHWQYCVTVQILPSLNYSTGSSEPLFITYVECIMFTWVSSTLNQDYRKTPT